VEHARLSDVAVSARARLRIQAMDCPVEARLIEKALREFSGVASLHFDFFERVLTVEHALPSLDGVLAAIERVGMQAMLLEPGAPAPLAAKRSWRRHAWFAASGLAALAAEVLDIVSAHHGARLWVMALALVSILAGGGPTLIKGWIALRSRELNIHFLMTLAVGGALLIGQWPEAAMVLFLFGLAEQLEAASLARAGRALRELMALAPQSAWVADDAGSWCETPVAGVMPGARVRVRPGERVPLDGEILSGHSAFNEAPITGESPPRARGF
jgi:Cd2+/Zn2+-exporting ATPase